MKLKPMTLDDADFMLALKNDPDTRRFAILTQDEIKREDHIKWLENNVQHFQVMTEYHEGLGNLSLGAIRIQAHEVSIWVDRPFRGKGIATETLRMIADNGLTAKIVIANIGSIKAFIRAGFTLKELVDNKYYILEYKA